MYPHMPNKKAKTNDQELSQLKVSPHSVEAEQAVLGGVMLDNTSWDKAIELVRGKDFYLKEHQIIFEQLESLSRRNHPFDVITVVEELKASGKLVEAGGESYIFQLAQNTPSAANINAYGNIVRERSVLRQLISVSGEVADLAFYPEGRSSKEILDQAESKIFKIAESHTRGQGPLDISSLVAKVSERIDHLYHSDEAATGLISGFNDLDQMTSGFQKGDLIIIAGRPSMGKTTFAMNIAEYAAIQNKKPILIFSMEMPGESLAMRMISSLGRLDQHRVRTGKLQDPDWPRLTSAISMLAEAPLFIDDSASLSPSEIRARARRLTRAKGPLGLIVIDYMQMMQIPGFRENRTSEITEISRALKILAKELDVPVLALSQLNRSLELRHDRRPMMSDLRESGAIEQDADLILFIYRDEVYNESSQDKGIAEIIVGKHRNGPIGKVRLTFLGQYTRFENFVESNFISGVINAPE
jgi:replicative DNA helicase